jgi:hypothetical protein
MHGKCITYIEKHVVRSGIAYIYHARRTHSKHMHPQNSSVVWQFYSRYSNAPYSSKSPTETPSEDHSLL